MQLQLPTPAPVDIHSIPLDSVVLPFGTPLDDFHGGVLKGVPTRPCILVNWTLWQQLWGLFHNLDSCPL
jgi:hypothetical protein